MKILYLTDRFLPEISAPCFRAMEHAQVWLDRGHEVTVVTCAPNSPRGKIFDGYRNRLYQTETLDGVRVIRLWSYMAANVGVLKRTLDYMSFMFSSIAMCWRFPRFDVIVASSPTFFTAVAGYVISILRRRPWVFLIRDLWPASIRAVGASDSRALDWVEKLELYLYRKAHYIVAVGNAIKADLVGRGTGQDGSRSGRGDGRALFPSAQSGKAGHHVADAGCVSQRRSRSDHLDSDLHLSLRPFPLRRG